MQTGNTEVSEDSSRGIIDIYGNIISGDRRLELIKTVTGLPAASKKVDFLLAVKENPIVIVQGETGSGKTTQLPKYLHIAYPEKQIVVTQPRVLAAMANAGRVAEECLAEYGNPEFSLGRRIGYRTGRGSSSDHISPLSFNTDGLELMRQAVSRRIPDIQVLDEVHNFAIPTEMVAYLNRVNLLQKNTQRQVKTVIMSATLNPEIFREYYKHISKDIPLIEIPGRTFPVDKDMDATDSYIERAAYEYGAGKSVIIFVPGKKEIEQNIEKMKEILGKNALIFPLHAEMPKSEQEFLLKREPGDKRPRIIVATNVAEESITIDYLNVGIDLATHKVARYNHLGVPGLYLENTSDANCRQRAGRVGRTKPGQYFRYNDTSSEELSEYPEAPLEREMIDRYILILLSQGIDIINVLRESGKDVHNSPFFHQFDRNLLSISLSRLQGIGALTKNLELTVLGYKLLQFPLDVYNARMIYEGIQRGCSGDMAIIAAILEKKGFVSKEDTWKELKIANSQESDVFGFAALFKFVTSKSITEKQRGKLIELGIDSDALLDFMDRKGEYKLYELVDLSPIGIKNKKIKEIDECIINTHARLVHLEIPIEYTKDSRIKRTCMATGSLHDLYSFTKEFYGFQNDNHKGSGRGKMTFKAGNISIIKPSDKNKYLGVPFIIGTERNSTQGLNLLSFITVVDEGILKDARHTNSVHAKTKAVLHHTTNTVEKSKHGKSIEGTEKTGTLVQAQDTAVENQGVQPKQGEDTFKTGPFHTPKPELEVETDLYISSLEEFNSTEFSSDEAASEYYLQYVLPHLLLEQNNRIRKYTQGMSSEKKSIFRELLSRFLVDEAHRISVKNLEKTEKSFKHDTGILQRFQESEDRYIRHFRIHGVLPEYTQGLGHKMEEIFIEDITKPTHEVFELQTQFARLIGETRQYSIGVGKENTVGIDLGKIQGFILEQYLTKLEVTDVTVGAQVVAYNQIGTIYEALKTFPKSEIQTMMTSLKSLSKKKKALEVKQSQLNHMKKIETGLIAISKGQDDNNSSLLNNAPLYFPFNNLELRQRQNYRTMLNRVRSKDARQNKRGMVALSTFIQSIGITVKNMEADVSVIENQLSLNDLPVCKTLLESLNVLIDGLFEPDYAKLRIKPKIIETVRSIVRDFMTENKGIYTILLELFNQTHAGEHVIGVQRKFAELREYNDSYDVIKTYAEDIFKEIKKTFDTSFIAHHNEGLGKEVDKLKDLYGKAMRNPLYIGAQGRIKK